MPQMPVFRLSHHAKSLIIGAAALTTNNTCHQEELKDQYVTCSNALGNTIPGTAQKVNEDNLRSGYVCFVQENQTSCVINPYLHPKIKKNELRSAIMGYRTEHALHIMQQIDTPGGIEIPDSLADQPSPYPPLSELEETRKEYLTKHLAKQREHNGKIDKNPYEISRAIHTLQSQFCHCTPPQKIPDSAKKSCAAVITTSKEHAESNKKIWQQNDLCDAFKQSIGPKDKASKQASRVMGVLELYIETFTTPYACTLAQAPTKNP